MPTDYIPNKDNDLKSWCENLSDKTADHVADFGLTPADVTEVQGICTAVVKAIDADNAAQLAAKDAMSDKKETIKTQTQALRKKIQFWKANPNYTDAIGADMDIIGSHADFDPDTYKPQITEATAHPGSITIKFTKKGVDGLNIYARLKGQPGWLKLAFDSHSPYIDNRPLAMPGASETREFMAIGVLDDAEIGQASDIVTVVFGG